MLFRQWASHNLTNNESCNIIIKTKSWIHYLQYKIRSTKKINCNVLKVNYFRKLTGNMP